MAFASIKLERVIIRQLNISKLLYRKSFILETDNQPLLYLGKAQYQSGRLMRWALTLQQYQFPVRAIKGSENVGIDFLSRHTVT